MVPIQLPLNLIPRSLDRHVGLVILAKNILGRVGTINDARYLPMDLAQGVAGPSTVLAFPRAKEGSQRTDVACRQSIINGRKGHCGGRRRCCLLGGGRRRLLLLGVFGRGSTSHHGQKEFILIIRIIFRGLIIFKVGSEE